MRKEKFADRTIEREPVDAAFTAGRVDEDCRRAIQNVAGRNLRVAGLEEVTLGHGTPDVVPLVHREDRAEATVDVDVPRAVERIVENHVATALRFLVVVGVDLRAFLRADAADAGVTLEHAHEDAVGQLVELLHDLALHVDLTGVAVLTEETGVEQALRDHPPRQGEARQDATQLTRGTWVMTFGLPDVFDQCGASHV